MTSQVRNLRCRSFFIELACNDINDDDDDDGDDGDDGDDDDD